MIELIERIDNYHWDLIYGAEMIKISIKRHLLPTIVFNWILPRPDRWITRSDKLHLIVPLCGKEFVATIHQLKRETVQSFNDCRIQWFVLLTSIFIY